MKFKTLYKKGSNKNNVLFSFLNKTPNFETKFRRKRIFSFSQYVWKIGKPHRDGSTVDIELNQQFWKTNEKKQN